MRRASVEAARVLALRNLQLLDSAPEQSFDDIVSVAATICAAPIALVSLVDLERQWFKARIGIDRAETGRDVSFCSVAIEHDDPVFEVVDTLEDDRFCLNPDVTGPPHYRFYAGVPLRVRGVAIGTLCVLDTVPRKLTLEQRESLIALARGTVATIEYRSAAIELTQTERNLEQQERDTAVFAAAVAYAQDAILILGLDERTGKPNRITYVNSAFSEMVGRDLSAVAGRTLEEVATMRINREAIERINERMLAGIAGPVMMALVLDNGDTLDLEMTVSELPEQSVDARLIVVLRNVSRRRAELDAAASERSEGRWQALFSRTSAIMYTLDRDLRFRSSAGGGLSAVGLIPGQVVGLPLEAFFEQSPDREKSLAAFHRVLDGESESLEHEVASRRFKTYLEPMYGEDGSVEGIAGLAFDITDYFAKTLALAESEAHVARTERTAQTGSWAHDLTNNSLTYSVESLRMFALPAGGRDREAFFKRIVEDDRSAVRSAILSAYETAVPATLEYRIIAHGTVRFICETVEISRDALDRAVRADGIFVDVTDRRLAELDALRKASTDDVTGMPNRAALRAHLDGALRSAVNSPGSVLMINIDRFRAANDALGRSAGDRLLRAAGSRIRSTLPSAYAARLENDLFVVVLAAGVDAREAAERLHLAFRARFESRESEADFTVSIGIVPVGGRDASETLVLNAELAVRSARLAGGDRSVVFSQELETQRTRRLTLDRDLFRAVERDEFELNYQPILDASGGVVSLEALLRWNHPVFGRVPPDEFIAIAEENGAILPIGRFVLRTACRDAQAIRTQSGAPLRIAVNISARQFSDTELQLAIHESLALAGLPAEALEVEVTETTIARDVDQATRVLADLRRVGIKVSVDDFGTGYSSLANLRRFPLHHLKIDRAFVAKIPGDAEDSAIVDAILGLARQLSLQTIAEGVETPEQARHLIERGCEMLQGYYYARPLEAAAAAVFVSENRRLSRKRRA